MSIRSIDWAFRQQCNTPAEKLVLLALADYANDEGECWPGQEHIAQKSGLARETVLRLLRSLEKQELIQSSRRQDASGRDIGKRYILRNCLSGSDNCLPGVTITPSPCDNYAVQDGLDVTCYKGIEPSLEPSENQHQKPAVFESESTTRITSDTPLPPTIQAEWDRLLEVYPKPRGIVKGKDRAVRLFVKSAERARILRNARHYSYSSDVARGFVVALDRFVEGAFRDHDAPEQSIQPSGAGPPGPNAILKDLEEAAARVKAEREQGIKRPPRPAGL